MAETLDVEVVEADGAGPPVAPSQPQGPRTAARWKAFFFSSQGDRSRRRRASDAVRLVIGVALLAAMTGLTAANTNVELRIDRVLTSAPDGMRWLVTAVFILGTVGVVAGLALFGWSTRNLPLLRDAAVACVVAWLGCVVVGWAIGPTGGRPVNAADPGSHGYPSVVIAATVAVAVVCLPYLSRNVRKLIETFIGFMVLAAVVRGTALPFDSIGSLAIGYVAAAATHLGFGSPTGLPSSSDVLDELAELGIAAEQVEARAHQDWGVAAFTACGADRRPLDISVYGRDAADAQVLAKVWRFIVYRDSGPTFILTRLQQVEHEAYLTLMAGHLGVRVAEVVEAGCAGAARDALLVTRPPAGLPLAALAEADIPESASPALFAALDRLRQAGIAHGSIGPATVMVDPAGQVGLRDFRLASSAAPKERLDADVANAIVAISLAVGSDRAAAEAVRHLAREQLEAALLHMQPAGMSEGNERQLGKGKQAKARLADLRAKCADAASIKAPELAKLQRVSVTSVIFAVGSLIGIWAIVDVLMNVAGSIDTIKGASWGWVAAVFVLSVMPPFIMALSLVSTLYDGVPLLQCVLLQESGSFTSLVGGTVARWAVTVRFFQNRGLDATFATSTKLIESSASWVVQLVLLAVALPIAWDQFHFEDIGTGDHQRLVNLVILVVVVAGVLAGVVVLVPRLRRLAWGKVKPQLVKALEPLRSLVAEPSKLVILLGGATATQLVTAFSLGAALHAFGAGLSVAALIVVIRLASVLGGVTPVPGGMGVVEAGMIGGLIAAGIPDDVAAAAVFVQRLFTAYLPPIWGWASLNWLRSGNYV